MLRRLFGRWYFWSSISKAQKYEEFRSTLAFHDKASNTNLNINIMSDYLYFSFSETNGFLLGWVYRNFIWIHCSAGIIDFLFLSCKLYFCSLAHLLVLQSPSPVTHMLKISAKFQDEETQAVGVLLLVSLLSVSSRQKHQMVSFTFFL